jgi:hypothetical protein
MQGGEWPVSAGNTGRKKAIGALKISVPLQCYWIDAQIGPCSLRVCDWSYFGPSHPHKLPSSPRLSQGVLSGPLYPRVLLPTASPIPAAFVPRPDDRLSRLPVLLAPLDELHDGRLIGPVFGEEATTPPRRQIGLRPRTVRCLKRDCQRIATPPRWRVDRRIGATIQLPHWCNLLAANFSSASTETENGLSPTRWRRRSRGSPRRSLRQSIDPHESFRRPVFQLVLPER